jgi:hypothetical protein
MATISLSVDRSLRNYGGVPGDPPERQPRQPAYNRPDDSEGNIRHVTRIFAVRHVPFRNQPRKQADESKQQGVYESVSQTETRRVCVIRTAIDRSTCGVESERQAGFKDKVVHHRQNNFSRGAIAVSTSSIESLAGAFEARIYRSTRLWPWSP